MAEWEHAVNAYEVLGLAQGPKATDAEISKVSRCCWTGSVSVCSAGARCRPLRMQLHAQPLACQRCSSSLQPVALHGTLQHHGQTTSLTRCIVQAYRAAALRYHPDKNKGDVEGAKNKFQAAKDARDLLSDDKARAALDALLRFFFV